MWQSKRNQEKLNLFSGLQTLLVLAFLLSIVGFVLLVVLIYAVRNITMLYVAIGIIGTAVGLTLVVAAKSLVFKPLFIDLESEIHSQLTTFFEHQNIQTYLKKGLRWEIHPKFYWLELHIIR